jgi:predicted MFS family arabinose efflux permease
MAANLRLFLFFSLSYFISYVFRGVNIGFAPFLMSELHLSASDLGNLTSLYFLGFAATQLPAGILLDTWGPRRVNALLLVVASLGAIIFSQATTLGGLMVGRLLIGIGVAVCMGASFQAVARTFPLSRLPLINGLVLAIGGLGGVAVGAPLGWLLSFASWRAVSTGLAVATLVVAGLLWVGVPRDRAVHRQATQPLAAQLRGALQLLRDLSYWRLISLPVATGGVFGGVQSLWIRPYLMEVNGLDAAHAAWLISLTAFAMIAGNIGVGVMARRVERLGLGLYGFGGVCMLLFLLTQVLIMLQVPLPGSVLWTFYGVFGSAFTLVYALLARQFPPALMGRVTSVAGLLMFFTIFLVQMAMGWIVNLWPHADRVYPPGAHLSAWGVMLVLQVMAAVWYFWPQTGKLHKSQEF